MPSIPKGIDSLPTTQIPDQWTKKWFITLLRTWLRAADVRNATQGTGIVITGNGTTPATISTSFTGTPPITVTGANISLTGGLTATITTAKLTNTGTQGSMTFTNGLLTAQTQAT
jgi:hypothetical protein